MMAMEIKLVLIVRVTSFPSSIKIPQLQSGCNTLDVNCISCSNSYTCSSCNSGYYVSGQNCYRILTNNLFPKSLTLNKNVRLIWILIAKLAQAQLHVVLVPQDGDLSDHIAVKTTNIGILVSLLLQALVLTVQVSILLAHRVIMQTLVPPAPHQWYRLVDNAYVLMADIMMLQLLPVLFAQA